MSLAEAENNGDHKRNFLIERKKKREKIGRGGGGKENEKAWILLEKRNEKPAVGFKNLERKETRERISDVQSYTVARYVR